MSPRHASGRVRHSSTSGIQSRAFNRHSETSVGGLWCVYPTWFIWEPLGSQNVTFHNKRVGPLTYTLSCPAVVCKTFCAGLRRDHQEAQCGQTIIHFYWDSFLTEWWRSLSLLTQNTHVLSHLCMTFWLLSQFLTASEWAGRATLEDCDHELGLNEWNPQMKGRCYLSVSRLDTQQDKDQSCQHPAKSEFKVEERKKQNTGTRCRHPVTYPFKHAATAKTAQRGPLRKGRERENEITDLAQEQNLKPRISKNMVSLKGNI